MNVKTQAAHYWSVLLSSHPTRMRFRLDDLLSAFRKAFPHHEGNLNSRQVLADLLHELAEDGQLRLPRETNRRGYDHSERIVLPRYATRIIPQTAPKTKRVWRPELLFANDLPETCHDTLDLVQEWLRNGGTQALPVALRERSVEIFGDEKYLDGVLGTQLFSLGRLSLDLLHCYLPSVPICVESIDTDGRKRPLLALENLTTFDTLRRWNAEHKRYSAVAYAGGTAFVSSCESLSLHLASEGCSGQLLYFGDVDPTGLWIPIRASREIGIAIQADENLYTLLFQVARRKYLVTRDVIVYEPALLDWLPAGLRKLAAQHFESGRRLPQELISLAELRS
jgi:hypothetical protein